MKHRWIPVIHQDPRKPWTMPGYTGKLKETPSMKLRDYSHMPLYIDDCVEAVLEMLISEKLSFEESQAFLEYYKKMRESGHQQVPDEERFSTIPNIFVQGHIIIRLLDSQIYK